MSSTNDLEEFNALVEKGQDESTTTTRRNNAPQAEEAAHASSNSETHNITQWAIHGGGKMYQPCEKTVLTLPSGQYTIDTHPDLGIVFSENSINMDELLILPDSASEEVINSIASFWKLEEHFRKFKYLWKRGILLWGPPGSGKTCTLQVISKQIIDAGGISVYITSPLLGAKGLELLRRIEPKRPVVVMLEDIDAIIESYGESEVLALLDGELQIDNVVFIATTNYPQLLDKRLVNRPSRFDIVKKIGMPSNQARETYLRIKNPRLTKNLDELLKWVELTKDMSIAHLKELIISVEVFNTSVDDAAKRLKAMNGIKITSEEVNDKFGFSQT